MTDEQFQQSAHAITAALLTLCERKGWDTGDVAVLAIAALGQVLTHHLGPVGAVERLRDAADRFEANYLDAQRG